MADERRPDLRDLVDRVMARANRALASKGGAGEAIVHASTTRAGNTRFGRNQITSTGDYDETSVSVHLALGKRHASTSANQIDDRSLDALVGRALAKLSPEDPEWMPVLPPQTYAQVKGAYDPATEALEASGRVPAVKAAADVARAQGLVGAGFYEHRGGDYAMATSAGLRARHASSRVHFTMTARTTDGTGSGWGGAESVRAAEIDAAIVANVAADKAKRSAKPRGLDPGRYTVILEPAAVADLLEFLTGSLDARKADEGRSFFAKAGGGTKVGEKIFGEVTLRSDPTDPLTPAAPFDDEGLPVAPITWIDRGTLQALAYSRFWAQKQGKMPTARTNAVHLLGGTAARADDLLIGVKKGLLITRFWYTRWVDPASLLVTGLTRDGVLLVEDGRVTGAVTNFRFNESPAVMLKNADLLTRATHRVPIGRRVVRVPYLRTHEFNLASVSAAV